MNPGRFLLTLAATVVSLLVVIDVAIRYRTYTFTRQFKIANVRTNDTQAVMILDGKTGKPLWGKWDLGFGGNPDSISFFFEGRNIMNVYPAGKSTGARRYILQARWKHQGHLAQQRDQCRFYRPGSV